MEQASAKQSILLGVLMLLSTLTVFMLVIACHMGKWGMEVVSPN